ncbi:MAG: pyruvate kinase [Solirubrobacterales bacterium]
MASRRTKIVTTLGPASWDADTLPRLIEAGADVVRLNFSHGSADEHAGIIERVRTAGEQVGREVAILGDLPGPKLRIGEIADEPMRLADGDELVLTTGDGDGASGVASVSVSWGGLTDAVSVDEEIFLADGTIRLRVCEIGEHDVRCAVEEGGLLSSNKGLNLPGSTEGLPSASERDLEWVDFAVEHGLDLLALSFVRSAADLEPVMERIEQGGSDIPVIPKIEKPEAVDNAEEIIKAVTAGVMIARGDLGIEIPIARVPRVQKQLIALAGRWSVPSITATQMLASMVDSNRPTRAEATDVANAIHDGTDAIMLSEETAIGNDPVAVVKVMARIAEAAEQDLPYAEWARNRAGEKEAGRVAGAVATVAVEAARRLGLAALVVPTSSGRTARLVSARRPEVPVLALSPNPETVRRVKLLFGVQSRGAESDMDLRALLDDCARQACEAGVATSGDLIGVTAGTPDQELGTNLFEVHQVP